MPTGQGLYIHIPFCARRCPYCDFAIVVGKKNEFKEQYLEALKKELTERAKSTFDEIKTINLGGGTPTALQPQQLCELLDSIKSLFRIAPDAEISIEGNPELLEYDKLQILHNAGWNRLSLGAQSFDDAVLKRLGRNHDAARIKSTFRAAKKAGFESVSLDLIYGVPGQSMESWEDTLRQTVELNPNHVSCYALTIEPQTAFAKWVKNGRMPNVNDDVSGEMMEETARYLQSTGFSRYEVSNWAKPGFECRHNLDIWRGGNYQTAGCGAHGHYEGHRWWNERDATEYVKIMSYKNDAVVGEEYLDAPQRAAELVALGLRLKEGLQWENLEKLRVSKRDIFDDSLDVLIAENLLLCDETALRVNPDHVAVTDAIVRKILR